MIDKQKLGSSGPRVGRLGYGAMVLEGYYGSSNDDDAISVINQALDAGITMIDSADAYGNGHNERLVSRAIKGRTDAFIATKFGIVFDSSEIGTDVPMGWGFSLKINGRPDYVRRSLDLSLSRLGRESIDRWYLHYPDPNVPIEETTGAMAQAISAGKVRQIGLSNVTAEQLWRREVETELLPTLRELGIALVAWSPLGAGFLTGTVRELDSNDFRQNNPRFSKENLTINTNRFAPLFKLAKELSVTPAQLALAWLLHQGDDIFPIPGTRSSVRVTENAKASEIKLNAEQLRQIDQIATPGITVGATLV